MTADDSAEDIFNEIEADELNNIDTTKFKNAVETVGFIVDLKERIKMVPIKETVEELRREGNPPARIAQVTGLNIRSIYNYSREKKEKPEIITRSQLYRRMRGLVITLNGIDGRLRYLGNEELNAMTELRDTLDRKIKKYNEAKKK